jgi:CO/xanthine dehydrogenase Mo-binding subunit/aerobic-type carbon monoxide dehydrogenase small subunit (CoxS/CutS family)
MSSVLQPGTLQLRMTVNGLPVDLEVGAGKSLLDVLRGELGLTGAKNGCDIGICGTCTVLVDGAVKKACVESAATMQGCSITTVEGIGTPEALAPIQQAFVQNTASQCGMCTPGFIVACHAYLQQNPRPTDRDKIRTYLRKNFCRCTGYEQIVDAVQEAAGLTTARTEFEKRCQVVGGSAARPVVGQFVPLVGAEGKVCGIARYADDLPLRAGTLHLAAVRSPHAHAVLEAIDAAPALGMEGVAAVWTAADIPGGDNYVGMLVRDQRVLVPVGETVKAVGDAVALVAAETQELARRAAAAVSVRYKVLPGVFDAFTAYKPDAPVVHPEIPDTPDPARRNLIHHQHIHKGDGIAAEPDIEQLFATAAARGWRVVEGDFGAGFQDHAPLEPEVALAEWDADTEKVIVQAPVQHVFFARRNIREGLGLEHRHVRVIGTLVGGAYGKREDPYAFPYCALATWLTRRPTRMLWTREETLQYTQKRHSIDAHLRAAVDAEGNIQAYQARIFLDGGAYRSWTKEIATKSAVMCSGPYEIPNVWIDTFGLYTNNPLCGACRGFGTANTMFAAESFWDLVCDTCGFDKVEFRRRNSFRKGSTTSTRQSFHKGVRNLECLDAAAQEYGWGRSRRRREGDWVFGTGIATIWYGNGFGRGIRDEGHPILEVKSDGKLHVWASSVDYGQGSNTVFTQVAADVLGLRPDQVVVHTADTDLTPNCGSTVASRVTVVVGKAVDLTARALRDDLMAAAARHLGAAPDALDAEGGVIWVRAHPERRIGFDAVAAALSEPLLRQVPKLNQEFTSPLDPETGAGKAYWPYVFGTHIVTAGVNLKTGQVKLVEYVAAHDVGRVVNPQSCRGQVIGGAAMGVGYALTEELQLDQGRVVSDNFDDYALPRATDLPDMQVILVEDPELDGDPAFGPNGAKGIGEPPTIAPAPAIVAALNDALRDLGVRFQRIPVTRARIRAALDAAGVRGRPAAGNS